MMQRLNQKQQRQLALALLLFLVLAVASVVIVPLWSANTSYQENIAQMQQRLQKLRNIAASDARLRPRYERIRAAQLAAGHYLTSNTEAVAAAELQRILKTLTATNGVQVLSTQILPTSDERQFLRVAIRARLRGTLPAIVDTAYSIETNSTFLFLDNVSLGNQTDRRRGPGTTSTQFEVNMDIVAYMPGTR